jgi:hypothetical protein
MLKTHSVRRATSLETVRKILFEPWSLGDAIIAASVARVDPDNIFLACNSKWHEVLTLTTGGSLHLLPLDLPYVWRTDKRLFSLGDAAGIGAVFSAKQRRHLEIISIRGDLRDRIAAQWIFKGALFNFSGWLPFLARKTSLFDIPFSSGYLAIRNRYRAWAEASGIPFSSIEQSYPPSTKKGCNAPVVVHVGAQWRSKQYPHVAELVCLLKNSGWQVEVLAGPSDPLPPEISSISVHRPKWPELVEHLRNAHHVITNDSGPMHLAAFLGCRTIALSRCSNILEWRPPGVRAISSPSAPCGYRPVPDYWSDQVLPGWPSPMEVMAYLHD